MPALERSPHPGRARVADIHDLPDRGVTTRARRKPVSNTADIAVVDEDRRGSRLHVVRVGVADGEVVDGGARCRPAFDRGDLDVRAGARLEPLAGLEVGGVEPLAEFGDPEGVAVGRGDLGSGLALVAVGVDDDLDQVLEALALDLGGDRLDAGFTGLGVGGDDPCRRLRSPRSAWSCRRPSAPSCRAQRCCTNRLRRPCRSRRCRCCRPCCGSSRLSRRPAWSSHVCETLAHRGRLRGPLGLSLLLEGLPVVRFSR
ncbi:hypothetical protein SUDANB21_02168 [Streptomyces sp. enrichment culture]